MRGALHSVGCVLLACVLFACAEDAESQRHKCERYRDHLVDLRVRALPSVEGMERDAASHRAALTQALGTEFISTCEQSMSSSQLDCGLRADDVSSAAGCGSK